MVGERFGSVLRWPNHVSWEGKATSTVKAAPQVWHRCFVSTLPSGTWVLLLHWGHLAVAFVLMRIKSAAELRNRLLEAWR